MTKKVAILHTSLVFIQKETMLYDIMAELLPDVEITNIIDDKMLSIVMAKGSIPPEVNRRMCFYALAAESMGVDAIFSVCSSLGPAADVAKELVTVPLVKIDEGMTEKAAKEGNRITVMATVPTTIKPAVNLINGYSAEFGRKVEIRESLSKGAFELLMSGEKDKHDAMVLASAKEAAKWSDMLVLAQASMTRLAPKLSEETGLTVLSSPRLGVQKLKTVLY